MKIIKLAVTGVVQLCIALLLILIIEGVLRVIGLGDEPPGASMLKYQQVNLPILEPAARSDGTAILQPADERLAYQSILGDRSDGSLRIITFGGSATAGLGFSPNATFASYLQRILAEFEPDREVEVLNLGIVALSSRQVKVLVEHASEAYAPDLVVIYSGNNEFLEIHAEKYAQAHQTNMNAILARSRETNIFRFLDSLLRGGPDTPAIEEQDFSNEDLRVTQRSMVQDIEMSTKELAEIVDNYEANIEQAVASAQAAGARVILAEVGSNWKWRGREDLPETWPDEFLEPGSGKGVSKLVRVQEALSKKLQSAPAKERSDLLFKIALASEQLGEFDVARENYRAAMNEDPHLRRAIDRLNDRLGLIAERHGAELLQTVEILGAHSPNGIVGFDMFYDYVHFTPHGALLVSAALAEELRDMGLVNAPPDFNPGQYVKREMGSIATLDADYLDVRKWMGMSDIKGSVLDRDLWKYEQLLKDLDTRLASGNSDFMTHVYRGNFAWFQLDGAREAEQHYLSALALSPDHPEVLRNLEHVKRSGRL